MNINLFEFKMKEAGFRTPKERAKAMGISLSAYYRRISQKCDCNKEEIARVAELFGWDVAREIFFS